MPPRERGATVTTRVMEDPGQYGRIVRDAHGDVERIVETKAPGDATPEELAIREINSGTYAFAVGPAIRSAREGRAPTTPRARCTSATPFPTCAPPAGAWSRT